MHQRRGWPRIASEKFVQRCIGLFCQAYRGDVFDSALRRDSGRNIVPSIRELVNVYRTHFPRITLCADSLQLLDELSGHPNVWIVTDGYLVGQCAKLAALNASHYVRQSICTDRWGREFWKPHPRAFQIIQSQACAAPRDRVYLADNPSKDFQAPSELGWSTLRIRRPGGLHFCQPSAPHVRPVLELDSLWPLCRRAEESEFAAHANWGIQAR